MKSPSIGHVIVCWIILSIDAHKLEKGPVDLETKKNKNKAEAADARKEE